MTSRLLKSSKLYQDMIESASKGHALQNVNDITVIRPHTEMFKNMSTPPRCPCFFLIYDLYLLHQVNVLAVNFMTAVYKFWLLS